MIADDAVHIDLNNADADGFVRLGTVGCIADLSRLGIVLTDGMMLRVTDGEISFVGTVRSPAEEGVWRLLVDWKNVLDQHASQGSPVPAT